MKKYMFRIEPLPAETFDSTIERFNELGEQGWHAVGKYSLNHMLFEREFDSLLEYHEAHAARKRS